MNKNEMIRALLSESEQETAVEKDLDELYEAFGFETVKFSQGYRREKGGTRQSPGIPDREYWHRTKPILIKHEAKTPAGMKKREKWLAVPPGPLGGAPLTLSAANAKEWKRAHEQERYRQRCIRCRIPYAIGGVDAALALLQSLGLRR